MKNQREFLTKLRKKIKKEDSAEKIKELKLQAKELEKEFERLS